jgi:nucleotide-binding universal stress UspA family protein
MASFNRILLCYDSTPEGRRALRQGAELAVMLGAETHLLAIASNEPSVVGEAMAGATMVGAGAAIAGLLENQKTVKDLLDDGVQRLQALGLFATGYLAFGSAVDEIAAAAQTLGVDLIVVGHKTRGALARWWAGPGESRLLDLVGCSVLVSIDPTDLGNKPGP